jgi:hypothetical protein
MSRSTFVLAATTAAILAMMVEGAGPRLCRAPPDKAEPMAVGEPIVAAPGRAVERVEPKEAERVDPIAAADIFAGETIRDREAGLRLIRGRAARAPKVGQTAPDFDLKTADGKQTIRLSSFRGRKPVVLIFGSHT